MTELDPDERRNAFLFSVQRSIRYHARREAFFLRLQRVNAFLLVLLGSAATVDLAGLAKSVEPGLSHVLFPFIVTVFAALDLVLRFSEQAYKHAELRRRFCEIEADVLCDNTIKVLRDGERRRALIEADEPPKKHALDILCHNELMHAKGYRLDDPSDREHFRQVSWWKRRTAHWFSWETADFPSLNDRMAS